MEKQVKIMVIKQGVCIPCVVALKLVLLLSIFVAGQRLQLEQVESKVEATPSLPSHFTGSLRVETRKSVKERFSSRGGFALWGNIQQHLDTFLAGLLVSSGRSQMCCQTSYCAQDSSQQQRSVSPRCQQSQVLFLE